MSTITERAENFQELFKQHQVSIGDVHGCEHCQKRREGQISAVGANTLEFSELIQLSEEDHWNVIKKITEAQIHLVESFKPDPVKEMLENLFGGAFPGAEVQVMSSDDFFKMQEETSVVPLKSDGKTHC